MADWLFEFEGPDEVARALHDAFPSVVFEADGRWLFRHEAGYDDQSKAVQRSAASHLEFLTASSLINVRSGSDEEPRVGKPIKRINEDGRSGVFMHTGPARYFNGGIRLLLHERAPEAIDPSVSIPDLASEFPKAQFWLRNHLLNSLRGRPQGENRAVIVTLLRRAEHAFKHYVEARERGLRFSRWDRSGPIPASDFYGAIEAWENCLLQLQIFYEVMNKKVLPAGQQVFEAGDGSVEQRVYEMANTVKHIGRTPLTDADLTPLWLIGGGIASLNGDELMYGDLADAVRDLARFADEWQDPGAIKERLSEEGDAE